MGRKGVISSHVTLYSRTERKGATQIAARSTAPISLETPSPPAPLSRTLCEQTVLSTCWSIRKGGSWGSLYETHPWFFTLCSIKLHQEKVWDAAANWQWHFLVFLGYSGIFWHTESYLNWQAILVQFGRNRDYETHPDKLLTFGWLQFGHASLIRQIPSFASPCELLVSIFRSLWQRSFT